MVGWPSGRYSSARIGTLVRIQPRPQWFISSIGRATVSKTAGYGFESHINLKWPITTWKLGYRIIRANKSERVNEREVWLKFCKLTQNAEDWRFDSFMGRKLYQSGIITDKINKSIPNWYNCKQLKTRNYALDN